MQPIFRDKAKARKYIENTTLETLKYIQKKF